MVLARFTGTRGLNGPERSEEKVPNGYRVFAPLAISLQGRCAKGGVPAWALRSSSGLSKIAPLPTHLAQAGLELSHLGGCLRKWVRSSRFSFWHSARARHQRLPSLPPRRRKWVRSSCFSFSRLVAPACGISRFAGVGGRNGFVRRVLRSGVWFAAGISDVNFATPPAEMGSFVAFLFPATDSCSASAMSAIAMSSEKMGSFVAFFVLVFGSCLATSVPPVRPRRWKWVRSSLFRSGVWFVLDASAVSSRGAGGNGSIVILRAIRAIRAVRPDPPATREPQRLGGAIARWCRWRTTRPARHPNNCVASWHRPRTRGDRLL